MNRYLDIELLEEGEKVNTYSPKFQGEKFNEFEKFFLSVKDNPELEDDLSQILYRIEKIQEDGANDRHFRYEGKKRDRVNAIPSHLETTHLRVYCIVINESIVILGNGGIKQSQTYNEDSLLNSYVEQLQKIDYQIKQFQNQKRINISGKELTGDLHFYIKD